MTKLIKKYYNNHYYNKLKNIRNNNKFLKKVYGNNIVLTEIVSNEDPYAELYKSMREEVWYHDSNYDY